MKEETDAVIPEAVITWVLAPLSGLLIGGFLFFRLHHLVEADVGVAKPGLCWYQGAMFLGGLGLAGIFPGRRLAATSSMVLGMAMSAALGEYFELSREPVWGQLGPVPVVVWFFFGLAGPLWGGAIVQAILKRTRIPRLVSSAFAHSVSARSAPSPSMRIARALATFAIPSPNYQVNRQSVNMTG